MKGEERREKILKALRESRDPISGGRFSEALGVSRQVIVQDIALLRAGGCNIYSTSRGYVLEEKNLATRVFKVRHTDEQVEKELTTVVDNGGAVEDVFVYHRVYGAEYLQDIENGQSRLLSRATNGYHYHTVTADSEEILDLIQEKLQEEGFLAKLQDYEPVDFWNKAGNI